MTFRKILQSCKINAAEAMTCGACIYSDDAARHLGVSLLHTGLLRSYDRIPGTPPVQHLRGLGPPDGQAASYVEAPVKPAIHLFQR